MDDETLMLDPHMDYNAVSGLSSEVRERLFAVRPTSIVSKNAEVNLILADYPLSLFKGAVKRMDGITPTSVVFLLRFAKSRHARQQKPDRITSG